MIISIGGGGGGGGGGLFNYKKLFLGYLIEAFSKGLSTLHKNRFKLIRILNFILATAAMFVHNQRQLEKLLLFSFFWYTET